MAKQKEKPSALSVVYSKFLWFDMFGSAPSFEVDGEGAYNTGCGALISFLILLLVVPYAFIKYTKMVSLGDTNYAESLEQGAGVKTPDDGFDLSDESVNFQLGYGIVGSQGVMVQDTDEFLDHLELTLTYRSWNTGVDENNEATYDTESVEIPIEGCSN